MTRDGEITAIFNPRRVRAPSVVVTGDSPNGGQFPAFTSIHTGGVGGGGTPHLIHSDSIASGHPDCVLDTATTPSCLLQHQSIGFAHTASLGTPTPTTEQPGLGGQPVQTAVVAGTSSTGASNRCRESCCSDQVQKMYFGVCVTFLVTASWVGATHCFKLLYLRRTSFAQPTIMSDLEHNATEFPVYISQTTTVIEFSAPFFASWFCTNFVILFFPVYVLGRLSLKKCDSPSEIVGDVVRGLRDRGFTVGRFINRCLMFCLLWQISTYLYAISLRALLATDAISLFATNVACAYLLSWVILHEQFVGVRIVAVIMCDTGIALLAYMDGITGSPTLCGVVLAVLAAAGYAVFKVMFRKVMREPPVGQVALTFSVIGVLNALLVWPVCLALYFSGAETMPLECGTWIILLVASIMLLVFHILTQFSAAITYNLFVTLGLITSVPVSAALDVVLYDAHFAGMKLAGIVLIAIGFFLVMFPNNWPDYITRLIRTTVRAILRYQCCCDFADIDYEHSKYHLVGSQCEMAARSPSRYRRQSTPGGHRLSHGLHSVPSTLSLRPREMTDSTLQLHMQLQHYYYSPIHPRSHSPNRLLDAGWSETSFADSSHQAAFGRKYSSYESSD